MASIGSQRLSLWRKDPVQFVKDNFKIPPYKWQAKVLKAFPAHEKIAMKACKGPGKTALLAWLILNFLVTRPSPKIAATSITGDNLDDNLWPELSKWMAKSPVLTELLEWTKTRVFMKSNPRNAFCSRRTWPESGDPQKQAATLAGLHADHVLFVLDESGDIPDAVMAAAEAVLANEDSEAKIVQAGNPSKLEGPLWRACTSERPQWFLEEITGDPDNPDRAPNISIKWAREQIAKYGRDNPWVKVNVFGEFPPQSITSLLGPDEVSAAMKRQIKKHDYDFAQKRMGIDVARFGDDSTIIFPRQGLVAFQCVELRSADTFQIAARVAAAKAKWKSELEFIDSTGGFGAGVEDALRQAGIPPIPIHFSSKPDDPRFFNKRSEMWWRMAEWIKRNAALPPDTILLRELTAPTYSFHNGKIQLEEKEQIKKRLGFSPDRADGLALTFAIVDQPRASTFPGMQQSTDKVLHDYDPFNDMPR